MVDKISACQDNFTVARYKQELEKPYSKADLFICKEADFKADSEMNDVSDFVEEKPLIDLPSDDDSIFDRSVLDIAHPSMQVGLSRFSLWNRFIDHRAASSIQCC